jgi:2-oxoisovalerate dehydrogenase E1 component alpha subunit
MSVVLRSITRAVSRLGVSSPVGAGAVGTLPLATQGIPVVRSLSSLGTGTYPGGAVLPYTSTMRIVRPEAEERIPVFRILGADGEILEGHPEPDDDPEFLVRVYTTMLQIQQMDNVLYDAQRQGRISFYMTAGGEEAVHIGTACALKDDDPVMAQYREQGVLMWRGFSLQQFADQCCSNVDDIGKGRQMPVHYGSPEHHFFTISSPLTTQVPQAAGAAYAAKLEGKGRCVTVFFGEGAASEGDFHAGMNFAATLEAPMIFFCRNNGYAISTPVKDQYRGDGIASRATGYGMAMIRVDGGDFFAVREATKAARALALAESRPVFIESMAYREGHHSTSDDSTRYRSGEEIASWREKNNPVIRFRKYLEKRGLWDDEKDKAATKEERKKVLKALVAAEKKGRPDIAELFTDVYAGEIPWHLREQEQYLKEHIAKYPHHYMDDRH